MENKQLFRKKSLDRISSPEQMNDYIRVSNPGIWMILGAIIVLLAGVCVWGVFGHLDTTLTVAAVAENGGVTCYVKEEDIASVAQGMEVRIAENTYALGEISAEPKAVDGQLNEYALHIGDLQKGQWVFTGSIDAELNDGVYSAEIVVDSVSPMSFVLN